MYDELLDRWHLPRPRSVAKTAWGWNNETFIITSDAGRHVLRISANAQRSQVEFEHELLSFLATIPLPFATPVPLPGATGTIEMFETARGALPATLFKEIPGHHPNDADVELVAAGAAAFAQLDRALATLPMRSPIRPMTIDLAATTTLAGIRTAVGDEAAQCVAVAAQEAAALSPTLPRQLIHGDFSLGNLLLDGPTVVGILDFEFCGHDLRAMELATALGLLLTKTTGDRLWRPFVTAYLGALPLSVEERQALPVLTRLSRAAGLLWWIGREREGLSSKTATAERVARLHAIDEWISRNADELVDHAMQTR